MKICVLIDAWEPIWGGGQTHVWEIVKRLVKNYGFTIDIFTRSITDSQGHSDRRDEQHFSGALRLFRIGNPTKFTNYWARITWLGSVMLAVYRRHRNLPYDIIHAHAYTAGIPAKLLGFFLRVPVVFTVHGSNFLDEGKFGVKYVLEKILLTQIHFDQVISVSHRFLKHANRNTQIIVIPNGVNVADFDRVVMRKKNDRIFRLLWVGRFDRVKGVEFLLQAVKNIVKIDPAIELSLVGYGYEEKVLRVLVKKLGISSCVTFLGKKPFASLVKLYKQSDVFVSSSLSEGQSLTLLEAWAAKLPIVVTDVGDNERLVKSGINGFFVPPGDVVALTHALSRVKAMTPIQRSKLGQKGYTLVKQKYTWDQAVEKLMRVYNTLAKT